jgi:hypothetical protein
VSPRHNCKYGLRHSAIITKSDEGSNCLDLIEKKSAANLISGGRRFALFAQ